MRTKKTEEKWWNSENLRTLVENSGMTQKSIAEASGIPMASFRLYLTEEVQPPTETLERFWDILGNTLVDDDGIIQESFLWWPKGTDREDIWRWFDEKYPGGVIKLMGLETQSVIDKLCEIGNPGFILTRKELEQLLEDQ